jgi:hypothetical protein
MREIIVTVSLSEEAISFLKNTNWDEVDLKLFEHGKIRDELCMLGLIQEIPEYDVGACTYGLTIVGEQILKVI